MLSLITEFVLRLAYWRKPTSFSAPSKAHSSQLLLPHSHPRRLSESSCTETTCSFSTVCITLPQKRDKVNRNSSCLIEVSQLKFLYPLKTLAFPAFSPLRFGPFPSFFPLREEMRETFFRPFLQPYPAALRKFAWPLWWRGRKCSSWYLHQNVPAAPAHPWVLPREREGWSYMYASTDGSENHPYPRSSFGSIGTHC